MLTPRGNIHRSKLPEPGEIGYLIMKYDRYGGVAYYQAEKQRYIVSHYPLCDNVQPYSRGIHTAYFRNLSTGKLVKVSGFYFSN